MAILAPLARICFAAIISTRNPTLLKAIAEETRGHVVTAQELGWDGDALEAQAFAFLAVRALRGLPLTFPGTTGAPRPLSGAAASTAHTSAPGKRCASGNVL